MTTRGSAWEGQLLLWSNAAMEATVFFLVLAAWARPRQGPLALLPLVAASSLLVALAVRRLLDSATVGDTIRLLATILAGLAWSFVVVRICAPPDYWQADAPRIGLILGAVFGLHPNAGPQPLAFWASLALWYRGLTMSSWEPALDEALGRLRLCCLVAGLAVGFASIVDLPGSASVQPEQLSGVAALLLTGLLTSGLARRREISSGSVVTSPRGDTASAGAHPRSLLAPLLVIGTAIVVLAIAAWGADSLSPEVLAPAVAAGQFVLQAIGSAVGAVVLWIMGILAGLLPSLGPPPQIERPIQPPTPPPEGLIGPPADFAAWLGPLLLTLVLVIAGGIGVLLVLFLRRALASVQVEGDALRDLDDDDRPTPVSPRGPAIVLALLARLFRAVWLRPRVRDLPSRTLTAPLQPTDPVHGSVREAYRAFLIWSAEHGVSRARHETPNELERRLQEALPESTTEVRLITSLYVDTRYGNLPCSQRDLEKVNAAVRLLRRRPVEPDDRPSEELLV